MSVVRISCYDRKQSIDALHETSEFKDFTVVSENKEKQKNIIVRDLFFEKHIATSTNLKNTVPQGYININPK